MFITLEGIDGVGKSTQARLLHQALIAAGHNAVLSREPGGAPAAELIRNLFFSYHQWDGITELLLMNAARREHVVEHILPHLAAGAYVVCDRFTDSSLVYQSCVSKIPLDLITQANQIATYMSGGAPLSPDLTFLIDLDPAQALRQISGRQGNANNNSKYERFSLAELTQLRQQFLSLAAQDPDRMVVIHADGKSEAEVLQQLKQVLTERYHLCL